MFIGLLAIDRIDSGANEARRLRFEMIIWACAADTSRSTLQFAL
jgi:hypothetical protein